MKELIEKLNEQKESLLADIETIKGEDIESKVDIQVAEYKATLMDEAKKEQDAKLFEKACQLKFVNDWIDTIPDDEEVVEEVVENDEAAADDPVIPSEV